MSQRTIDLGFIPRSWQGEIYRKLKRFSVVVVHRRGGKTVQAVMRLIHAALKFTGERGRFAYIAPLLKQAKAIAWDYLKHYAMKVPGTRYNESELWVQFTNGARIRIYGADNPDSLRGLYFDGVVLDELGQIKRELWGEVIVPSLADRNGWAMLIGTPQGINLLSELYYAGLTNPEWYVKLYTVYDTGVFTPAQIEEFKRTMTAQQFAQEMMCDFQASSANVLISIADAREAEGRFLRIDQYNFAPKVLGVDVAWQGGDRSVIFPRQGLCAFEPRIETGLPEKTFAGLVGMCIDKWKADATFVDTTGGYGGEVVSRLRDNGYRVQEVVFSWKAASERFLNLRAEMWFKMAEWIKGGGSLPKCEGLLSELCAPTYSNDSASNRLTLESKDRLRERLGFSTDLGDGLAISFAFPVANPRVGMNTNRRLHALVQEDPLA